MPRIHQHRNTGMFAGHSTPSREQSDSRQRMAFLREQILTDTGAVVTWLEPCDVRTVTYICPRDHAISIPLDGDAPIPTGWECLRHRELAQATGDLTGLPLAEPLAPRVDHQPKTHWENLRARRSDAELEALLQERLALLRVSELADDEPVLVSSAA